MTYHDWDNSTTQSNCHIAHGGEAGCLLFDAGGGDGGAAATGMPLRALADTANAALPEDVRLRRVALAPHRRFDALSDAKWKRYRYTIPCAPGDRALRRAVVWQQHDDARRAAAGTSAPPDDDDDPPVFVYAEDVARASADTDAAPIVVPEITDAGAMAAAAASLVGTHDFGAFQASRARASDACV